MIATLLQDVWHIRKQGRQRTAKIGYGVELWVCPGKNCGVRNRRQRRLGIGPFKHHSLPGEQVQIRREPVGIAQKAHSVGARRIHCNYNNVGCFGPGSEAGGQDCDENEQPGTAHKNKKEFTKGKLLQCLRGTTQKENLRPNCMLRCAPVPRIGLNPRPTSGVAKKVPNPLQTPEGSQFLLPMSPVLAANIP